ncbi:MAG: hypothetical protein ACJ76H_05065 [Bacteriovoracaceae bacterium]
MKTLSWKNLVPVTIFVIVTACGGSGGGYGGGGKGGGQSEQAVSNFSTRINDSLAISGQKCNGTETTTDSNGQSATCNQGQWLVTLDNVNTCTNGTACTQVAVTPFVADLNPTTDSRDPGATFYDIVPDSSVSTAIATAIDQFEVRVDNDSGATSVIKK